MSIKLVFKKLLAYFCSSHNISENIFFVQFAIFTDDKDAYDLKKGKNPDFIKLHFWG